LFRLSLYSGKHPIYKLIDRKPIHTLFRIRKNRYAYLTFMKKILSPLWILTGAIVVGIAIYALTAPPKEKPWTPPQVTQDAHYELLMDIQRETGISFTFMIDKEFPWIGKKDGMIADMMISGKQWMAPEMSEDQWTAITSYFTNNAFVQDVVNVGANPNGWQQDAYKKNDTVCTVVHMAHTQGNLILEIPGGMTLSCGTNPLEEIYVPTKAESVTYLLASALNVPRSSIKDIALEKTSWDIEGVHIVRGIYTKKDDPYPRTFIAKKTDAWYLVISGEEGAMTCEALRSSLGISSLPEDLKSCSQR